MPQMKPRHSPPMCDMDATVIREVIIEGVSVPVGTPEGDVLRRAEQKLKKNGFPAKGVGYRIFKKSVDARKREDRRPGWPEDRLVAAGFKPHRPARLELTFGDRPLPARPLVVGMGPAGLFCAYLLAREGYEPILIDRGDCVADRVKAVDGFYAGGRLDTESNIQFGAGGAGPFSDCGIWARPTTSPCKPSLT